MNNKNLLIVGAGTYGMVAKEIAESMNCFKKIDFVDDSCEIAHDGTETVGNTSKLDELACEYGNIVVAIGNPDIRLSLLRKIGEELPFRIVSLVSPRAFVASSVQMGKGCIVEPMAVVHTESVLCTGCIISAGAIVNHASMCCDGVHVDCNATVASTTLVPAGMKINSGMVYDRRMLN